MDRTLFFWENSLSREGTLLLPPISFPLLLFVEFSLGIFSIEGMEGEEKGEEGG